MSSDSKMKLTLTLGAKDSGASTALKKLETDVKTLATTTTQETKKSGAEQVRVIRTVEREQRQAAGARARLGIRSEQEIRREINRTQQAYAALASSGKASQREMQRAATVTRARIRELNAEMGKSSKFAGAMKWGKAGGALIAGGVGAAMMLKDPIEKRRNFDLNLAYAANTAYSDRDSKGRIAGKQELYDVVKKTVTEQGGSRDQALDALNSMIASGTVEVNTAKQLLPVIQRASVASGADSNEVAQIAISAMQQYHIKPEEVGLALDKAMAAGQAGQFELNDMAKWLPQAMAATANGGMNGMKDFDVLLRSLQQTRITAGSADEGGNNFVNLAAKITSADAVTKFQKAEYIDKNGKKHSGIDLTQSLLKHKQKGENTLDAFMNIVDEYMSSNKQYQDLQKKIAASKNDTDKKQLLEQQATILSGTAVGELVSDRQALMALLAIKNNKDFGNDVMKELQNAKGTVDTAHAVIQDTTFAKKQNFDNTKDFGAMESLKGMDEALGDVNQKLADYGNKYPELGKMIGGTSVAFGALTTAAMAAAGSLGLMSLGGMGKGKLGKVGKLAKGGGFLAKTGNAAKAAGSKVWSAGTKVASGGAKGTASAAGKVAKGAGKVIIKGGGKLGGPAGAVITVGIGGYNAYQIAHDNTLNAEQKKNEQIKNASETSGALAGMAAGATAGAVIGSFVPVVGTAIGGFIGSIIGGIGGAFMGKKAGEELTSIRPHETRYTPESMHAAQMAGIMPQPGQMNSRFDIGNIQPTALAADKVQPAIIQQTADFQAAMQTNSSELGARLERINSTLASQQQVIRNEISLSVDGRVIAEQVSERQLQMFGRG
ncbi:MAG: phage tail tape measure protein [Snodgrassella sp.]|uniref:phage tail tape measure protein n=1 Tax=Snodgrassella sp. TaxID=2815304 RepID=UPI00258B4E7E|nr:phage tail tape measure protein [Snodgrassella sp.]MCO6514492.1 phage tail tape measure protein [Snodgrassella sp.]MCO6520911.1 phage tail tape measure protein [Snodgrassella sp.]